ncbi:MAG: DUF951 domain-containing protein [Christensenellaceae bacterium]|jgi:hypothetical protein
MYELNEILTMKKPHPCGGREWEIVRTGADIKLKCLTCGKTINLMRDDLKKRVKIPAGEKERKL